jgi:DNA-binding response OmpR family regulator
MDAVTEPLTVAIVDDEPDVRRLVRLALERSRLITVVAESDGHQASLDEVCRSAPDVVLLDQRLDGVRGTELIGEITRKAPRAMIAMLTALDADSEEAIALSAGAFVFYEKSLIADVLATCIIDDHRMFRSALDGREVHAPSARSRRTNLEPEQA